MKRSLLVLDNSGYPLSTWLAVHFIDDDGVATITSIDIYRDEACTSLIVDGLELASFDDGTQQNIHHALHAKMCVEADKAAFARQLERAQLALIDTVVRVGA